MLKILTYLIYFFQYALKGQSHKKVYKFLTWDGSFRLLFLKI
jgi:hypothetical protein